MWKERVWRLLAAGVLALATVSCGGRTPGRPSAAAVEFAQRAGAAAQLAAIDPRLFTRKRVLAAGDSPSVRRAATELFDLGERAFAQFFPSRQPDRLAGNFAYRYYPDNGAFLVVDQSALQVYVLGGPFGPAITFVGNVIDFLPCQPVSTGFPEEQFESPGGGDGGGGGGGGGDGAGGPGGDGGVGGSSADGAIRGADVRLYNADGVQIGIAVSDDKGTVRLKACGNLGPFRIEFRGNENAAYFDEAVALGETASPWRPFTSNDVLVAYVPDLRSSVGISTLTHASAQLVESAVDVVPVAAAARSARALSAPVAATPKAQAITKDRVRAANERVRSIINQQFTGTGLAVADILKPPTLAYSARSLQVLGNDDRGRYAQVLAALAKGAAAFNPGLANPAREMTKQLGKDLSDGVLDGRDGQGTPVAPADARAYEPQVLAPTVAAQSRGRLTLQVIGTGNVAAQPAGEPCAGGGAGSCFPFGAVTTLTAQPGAGSTFVGWSGACSGSGSCTLTMAGDKTVTATFNNPARPQVLLTVSKSGSGIGTVTSAPAGIDCGSACSRSYESGTLVTLTAVPGSPNSLFTGWSGDCSGSSQKCTVTMSAARTVSASFGVASPTLLTVTAAGSGGGTVASTPSGIVCASSCSSAFEPGTAVTLRAVAARDSGFVGWSGDCAGQGSCTVTMDRARNVTATFNVVTPPTINVNRTGPGSVRSTPTGIDCGATCSAATFLRGSTVTLTATPDPGATFIGWSGDCNGVSPTCLVSAIGTLNVNAAFDNPRVLSVNKTGTGSGVVSSTPAGISCGPNCSSSAFPPGSSVTLVAAPSAGSLFVGWSGACGGAVLSCTVTMSGSQNVTAAFDVPLLVVNKIGSGTVSSSPTGIDCGASCSNRFPADSILTLTATPAAGWTFAGWSGNCVAAGSTCTVTMNAPSRSVTASFTINNTPSWAWMTGSPGVGGPSVWGNIGIPAAANTPGLRYDTMQWIDASGNLWLFGGYGLDGFGQYGTLNDLWVYLPGQGWAWAGGSQRRDAAGVYGTLGVASPNNVPGARSSAVSWTDATGNFWLFGGFESQTEGTRNDLWRNSAGSRTWAWMGGPQTVGSPGSYGSKGLGSANNLPPARFGSGGWADAAGNLWLFGGCRDQTCSQAMNDLWRYSLGTGQWTWVSGSNQANATGDYGSRGVVAATNVPGARTGFATWVDSSGNLWLFGGTGFAGGVRGRLNDLWRYSPGTDRWTWISGSSAVGASDTYGALGVANAANVPGSRASALAWTGSSGTFWLLGGLNAALGVKTDLWRFDPSSGNWTWMGGAQQTGLEATPGARGVSSPQNFPASIFGGSAWRDANGTVWIFGGNSSAVQSLVYRNTLWQLQGTR